MNPDSTIRDISERLIAAGTDPERLTPALAYAVQRLPEAERRQVAEAAAVGDAADLDPLPGEAWQAVDPPPREWIVHGLLPAGRLASLYGAGAAGKSTLAMQIAAAVMHGGAPLRTRPVSAKEKLSALEAEHPVLQPLPADQTGRVLWLTWEDEISEVIRRWRMAFHAGAIGPDFPDPERLTLVDMRKVGGPLWGPAPGQHVSTAATWTEAGQRFLRTLQGHRLAIVDPLAAAFASSEIDRALVRAFTSAIDGEAEAAQCAVLLIAHPSQTGAARGGGSYSGSTDWQASVRTHLTLEVGETAHMLLKADGNEKAPAYRLANLKQSYAPDGSHLWLTRHWHALNPETNMPAQLAWFGAHAGDAARTFEYADARRTGRAPQSISTETASKSRKEKSIYSDGWDNPPR